jgi:hypothetical protein
LSDSGKVKKPLQVDKMFGFSDWHVVSSTPVDVGELSGLEMLGKAQRPNGIEFFFHASYLVYGGDDVGLIITTRGRESQRENALARVRRMVESIRRLDNSASRR